MTVSDPTATTTNSAAATWRTGALSGPVARAVATVGIWSLLVRVAMTGRDLALAKEFGTGDAADAFVVAMSFPVWTVLIVSGSIAAALIPVYTKVATAGGAQATRRLVSNVVAVQVAITVTLGGVLALAAPLVVRVVGSGFDAEKLALTRSLFLIMLGMLIASSMSATWSAVLNANRRFALAAATPLVPPTCAVLVLVFGAQRWGIRGVAWAITFGAVIEACILATAVWRTGESPLPRWTGLDAETRAVYGQYLPAAASALLMSTNVVVDFAVAGSHSSGSVAALNYGGKPTSFFTGAGALALGTVALPHLSALVERHDWGGVRRTMRSYARLAALLTVPIVVGMIAFARPIVALLFERDGFGRSDTNLVSDVLAISIVQLPFYLLCVIGLRTLNALRMNVVVAKLAAVMLLVNLGTDIVLLGLFGVPGIALASCVLYASLAGLLFVAAERRLRALCITT